MTLVRLYGHDGRENRNNIMLCGENGPFEIQFVKNESKHSGLTSNLTKFVLYKNEQLLHSIRSVIGFVCISHVATLIHVYDIVYLLLTIYWPFSTHLHTLCKKWIKKNAYNPIRCNNNNNEVIFQQV